MRGHRAILSSDGCYTVFSYGPHTIRFESPAILQRYVRVKQWDRGYLVVDALYGSPIGEVEEYIDLRPILENLYLDSAELLSDIREVEVCYDSGGTQSGC